MNAALEHAFETIKKMKAQQAEKEARFDELTKNDNADNFLRYFIKKHYKPITMHGMAGGLQMMEILSSKENNLYKKAVRVLDKRLLNKRILINENARAS